MLKVLLAGERSLYWTSGHRRPATGCRSSQSTSESSQSDVAHQNRSWPGSPAGQDGVLPKPLQQCPIRVGHHAPRLVNASSASSSTKAAAYRSDSARETSLGCAVSVASVASQTANP